MIERLRQECCDNNDSDYYNHDYYLYKATDNDWQSELYSYEIYSYGIYEDLIDYINNFSEEE